MDRDPRRHQPGLDPELLIGHDGPARHFESWRDEGHLPPRLHQLLRDRARHVVLVVIVDHHATLRQAAGQHIVGGEDPGRGGIEDRLRIGIAGAVPAPGSPRRQDHMAAIHAGDIGGGQPALEKDLHIGQPADLSGAIVAHPAPARESRQAALQRHAPAQLPAGFGEHDPITALAQGHGAFQPGRPAADHQHGILRVALGGRHALGMPTAAILFPHGGILGAADRHPHVVMGAADVAADAFADLILAALGDLARQPGIGDGGPCRADEIEDSAADLGDHHVRRGEAPDADHGLAGQLLHLRHIALLESLLGEAGAHGIVLDIGDVDVPEIGKLGQERDDLAALALEGHPLLAQQLIHGEADSDRASVADGLPGHLDHLAQQPGAVGDGAAIFVAAPVPARRDELEGQIAMTGIAIDDVETCLPGAPRRIGLPAQEGADIGLVHGPGLLRDRDSGWARPRARGWLRGWRDWGS